MKDTAENIRFAVLATDVALFAIHEQQLKVLLIEVDRPPHFAHMRGLPGGLIRPKETADQAAHRILAEKGGMREVYLEQLYTFSGINRDPRGRVVSVAYIGLVEPSRVNEPDAVDAGGKWVPVRLARSLAYDHDEMLAYAIKRLRAKLGYTTVVQHLLTAEFTLTELQAAYQIVLGKKLDKRNFRKKFLSLDVIAATGKQRRGGKNRPAELYRFNGKSVKIIEIL